MNNASRKRKSQGRPPASKGEDRREHILDNALALFSTQGIAGTTVAQIAKASGVTSAMVHYYFNNREGLLDALVAERLAAVLEYVWVGVSAEISADPRRIVTECVDRLLESIERMPQLPLLWSREILNAGGLLRERILPLFPLDRLENMRRSLAEAQQEGRMNGKVVPGLVLPSVMAMVMLPLAAQAILGAISPMLVVDQQTLRRHALAVLLDGLCAEKNLGEQA